MGHENISIVEQKNPTLSKKIDGNRSRQKLDKLKTAYNAPLDDDIFPTKDF